MKDERVFYVTQVKEGEFVCKSFGGKISSIENVVKKSFIVGVGKKIFVLKDGVCVENLCVHS